MEKLHKTQTGIASEFFVAGDDRAIQIELDRRLRLVDSRNLTCKINALPRAAEQKIQHVR